MSVDLGEGRQLAPDYYCLRHGDDIGEHVLRTWRLEGSNDGTTWTILKTHANDAALAEQAHSTASWPIQAPAAAAGTPYRHTFASLTTERTQAVMTTSCAPALSSTAS